MPKISLLTLRWSLFGLNLLLLGAMSWASYNYFLGDRDELVRELRPVNDFKPPEIVKSGGDQRQVSAAVNTVLIQRPVEKPRTVRPVEPVEQKPIEGGPIAVEYEISYAYQAASGENRLVLAKKSEDSVGSAPSRSTRGRPTRRSRSRTVRRPTQLAQKANPSYELRPNSIFRLENDKEFHCESISLTPLQLVYKQGTRSYTLTPQDGEDIIEKDPDGYIVLYADVKGEDDARAAIQQPQDDGRAKATMEAATDAAEAKKEAATEAKRMQRPNVSGRKPPTPPERTTPKPTEAEEDEGGSR